MELNQLMGLFGTLYDCTIIIEAKKISCYENIILHTYSTKA